MKIPLDFVTIIVNYKNEEKTIQYVKNELSKINSTNVVIVNNAATEASNNILISELNAAIITDILTDFKMCNCYIIPSIENLGFAKGNNLGVEFLVKHFNVKYILFSNNDIRIVNTNVIDELVRKMDLHPDIGMIGPNCIGIDSISQSPRPYLSFWSLFILRYWISPFVSLKFKRKFIQLDYAINAKEGDHYKLSGSFFMVRVADFIQCGMMDPNTFLYCEEEILTERMYAIGKRVYYAPEVRVMHEHGQTIGKFIKSNEIEKIDFQSNCYYYHTYRGISNFVIYWGRVSFFLSVQTKFLLKKFFHYNSTCLL